MGDVVVTWCHGGVMVVSWWCRGGVVVTCWEGGVVVVVVVSEATPGSCLQASGSGGLGDEKPTPGSHLQARRVGVGTGWRFIVIK